MTRSRTLLPVPVITLLDSARRDLADAARASCSAARYAGAHRAALHGAAAVLAARARPDPRSRSPRSVWTLLAGVAPQLHEWAQLFAAGAGKRAAAEAGLHRAVTTREADDLLRDAESFLALVETVLGLDPQLSLPRLNSPSS